MTRLLLAPRIGAAARTLLALFLLAGPVEGADPGATARPIPALEAAFDRELPALLVRDRVPGASAAIVHRGNVVWERAAGVVDRESQEPVATETTFQVASLSKPVAALGVLLLVEEGRIDLDRPVWDYIESWRPKQPAYDLDGVTVRRLLAHRAGIGVHGYPGYAPWRALPPLLASLDGDTVGASRVALVAPPGAGVRYSSGGYTILQLLVEETTGERFAAFMDRRVLRPLGMTRSSFETPAAPTSVGQAGARPSNATGHGWWGERLPAYRFREQAASGLYSTPGDLARFLRVLWSAEVQAAVGISASTIETMLAPVEGGGFALGFGLEPLPIRTSMGAPAVPGARIVSHNGANRGFRSILAAAPDRGDGFVVLTNSDRALAMTTDLLCAWGSWVTDLELASCWAERKRRGTLLAVAIMLGVGLLLDCGAFVRRQRQRRLEPRPWWAPVERHTWVRWTRLGVSLALLAGWWLFWYTDEIATRREGIEHFVPASALPPTFFWLTLVLTAWCLLGTARWLVAVRALRPAGRR
ncbi:MAG TPA: serine hydrolase domain-containing protein [Thermoanaerobaculia bacterium]|nr:serine hydrolase domain-containing protein [Thermoanaerobaculia bacterium]